MSGLVETYRGVAHPWLCDAMGHLNTRHYVGMFDDATIHFMGRLGVRGGDAPAGGGGWADARNLVEYEREVPPGALVVVSSGLTRIGTKSLSIHHEMRDPTGQTLHATMETVIVHFDLYARRALPLPGTVRERAAGYLLGDSATR